ncbi:hypothetical protein Tco_0628201 [Tanacetum coccineum]|uniref:Uncharacterized protein n=1 Tax=Tanacetum coccineum TaxID=301880 RepID=A0ABQ4WPM8_9ASTR
MNIEALQTKYPIINWEVYTEDSRMYWKIIRVGNHTEVYQVFKDMLKTFDRDDLVKLCSLVQERFNSIEPTEDKEIEIWVELKRLFEPDADDELWCIMYLQRMEWISTCWLKGTILFQERSYTDLVQKLFGATKTKENVQKIPLGRYSCRLKDQEDKVFGRILS